MFVETQKTNFNEWVSGSDEKQDPKANWEFFKMPLSRAEKFLISIELIKKPDSRD